MNVVPMPAVSDLTYARSLVQRAAKQLEQAICEAETIATAYPLFLDIAALAGIMADLREAAQSRLAYLEQQEGVDGFR